MFSILGKFRFHYLLHIHFMHLKIKDNNKLKAVDTSDMETLFLHMLGVTLSFTLQSSFLHSCLVPRYAVFNLLLFSDFSHMILSLLVYILDVRSVCPVCCCLY